MIYKINDSIYFSDEQHMIWSSDNEDDKVSITSTTCRLFSFLLQSQGDVLTRDCILIEVWDAYGLRSTNNTLNKYISDLRNIMKRIGLVDDVIITLPKVGFKISESIDIEVIDQKESLSPNNKSHLPLSMVKLCTVIILTLVFVCAFFFYKPQYTVLNQSTYPIGKIKNCSIYSLKNNPKFTNSNTLIFANRIIEKNGIECDSNRIIYINVSDDLNKKNIRRSFVANCIVNTPENLIYTCDNIYEYEDK